VVGFTVVTCYAAWLSALFYLSFLQLGSWGWLKEVRKASLIDLLFIIYLKPTVAFVVVGLSPQVYGFIFFAPDLTPNIGLFWYYFTEAFMHFRPFFIFVFQYHPVIYVLPLTIRFRYSPSELCLRTTAHARIAAHAHAHTHTRITHIFTTSLF
jgi:hypothetical protein